MMIDVSRSVSEPPRIQTIHHPALRCKNAEETRNFYENILGLQRAAACPSDNDYAPNGVEFLHIFFRMQDGDFLAFFDVPALYDGEIFAPYNDTDMRLTLRVDGERELEAVRERLAAAGVGYRGPTSHGVSKSIHLDDPNGIHLEIIAAGPAFVELIDRQKGQARQILDDWVEKHTPSGAVN